MVGDHLLPALVACVALLAAACSTPQVGAEPRRKTPPAPSPTPAPSYDARGPQPVQGSRISLGFGGDVMAGRRFYDHDDDGDPGDGLLRRGAGADEHGRLLAGVAGLLAEPDLTVVTLESPLLDDPWWPSTGPRPRHLHPTKPYVLASAPALATALRRAGVDVVSLGNNHIRDGGDRGVGSTLAMLDRVGIAHFGAGRDAQAAWRPATMHVRGQRVAFLGCTTITGDEHATGYTAGRRHGGAARCQPVRLDRAVRSAARRADVVVVMLHGGFEYERRQSSRMAMLSGVALRAGARLVVNGHSHVVGAIRRRGDALVAASMGNLLFDQTVWPTMLGYFLRAEVGAGSVGAVMVQPFVNDGYLPSPVVGRAADAAVRLAAGPHNTPFVTVGGRGLLADRTWHRLRRQVQAEVGARRLAPGWWSAPGQPHVRVGSDLLWTGSFEDEDRSPATDGALLWETGEGFTASAAACSGELGVLVGRTPGDLHDAVLTPRHRQPVVPGQRLSLLASLGALPAEAGTGEAPRAQLELRWYADLTGRSYDVSAIRPPLEPGDRCRRFRLDVTAPPGAAAVQPYVRLAPPARSSTYLTVDDVALVRWGPAGAGGRRWSYADVTNDRAVRVVADVPPDGPVPAGPWAR